MATNEELRRAFGTMIECRKALFQASEKELKAREAVNYHALKGMACLYAKSREA